MAYFYELHLSSGAVLHAQSDERIESLQARPEYLPFDDGLVVRTSAIVALRMSEADRDEIDEDDEADRYFGR